jgi:hypothetical protein
MRKLGAPSNKARRSRKRATSPRRSTTLLLPARSALGVLFVSALSEATQGGYLPGKNALAVCYMTGFGVAKDEAHAVRLLEECVAAGFAGALVNLASALHAGHGVVSDQARAFELFKRSYEECGDQDAAFHVGLAYLRGTGANPNHELAFKIFKVCPCCCCWWRWWCGEESSRL